MWGLSDDMGVSVIFSCLVVVIVGYGYGGSMCQDVMWYEVVLCGVSAVLVSW
jgi:hypothetical protein